MIRLTNCLIVAVLLCMLTGCMHTSYVTPETPPDSLARINKSIAPFSGSVTTLSGDDFRGNTFRIGMDSTSWRTGVKNTVKSVSSREIKLLDVRDHKRGLVEGIECGALAGAIIGTTIGALAYLLTPERVYAWAPPDSTHPAEWLKENEHRRPFWQYGGMGALMGGAVGAGFGIYIGGAGGSMILVKFSYPPSTK